MLLKQVHKKLSPPLKIPEHCSHYYIVFDVCALLMAWKAKVAKNVFFLLSKTSVRHNAHHRAVGTGVKGSDQPSRFLKRHYINPISIEGECTMAEMTSIKGSFLALGARSQSWKLNNLWNFFSCQIDWCYKLLTTIWQKFFFAHIISVKLTARFRIFPTR